jgi:uncharacterized protein YfaS (alpha-2-macroglobulin family)
MNKRTFQLIFFSIVIIAFGVIIKNYIDNIESDITEYKQVLESIPDKQISRLSPIIIKLARDIQSDKYPVNEPLKNDIIKFKPDIEGFLYFTDKRTIEFQPDNPLPTGTSFKGIINTNKLFPQFKLKPFRFNFTTPNLDFTVKITDINYCDSILKTPVINGYMVFNDYVEYNKVNLLLEAVQQDKKLPVIFSPSKNDRTIKFIIKDIGRQDFNDTVKIKWTGKPVKSKSSGQKNIIIASNNQFKVTNIKLKYFPVPVLTIYFTDSINPDTTIDSLINISNLTDYKAIISGNKILIKFNKTTTGKYTLTISDLLSNVKNIPLSKKTNYTFTLTSGKPVIKFANTSVYKPHSDFSQVIDINALNLKSINLKIVYVPDKNMMQFLQVNNINDNKEIQRVGIDIFNKKINLTNNFNYNPNQLTLYSLNILDVDFSRKGLYNFIFSYSKKDIVNNIDNIITYSETSQNIILSDIYAVAKLSATDSLYIFVSDMKNGNPIDKVKIEVFDFQQNKIASLISDKKGSAKIKINKQNLFIKVTSKNDVTYLKITPATQTAKTLIEKTGIKTNKGILCYVDGIKNGYFAGDTLNTGIILKKNGLCNSVANNIIIKIKSPSSFFYNTKVVDYLNSIISTYKTVISKNAEPGIWNLTITADNAVFNYPFNVFNPQFSLTDSNKYCKNIAFSTIKTDTANSIFLNKTKPDLITIITNKESYQTDDSCKITVFSKKNINALLTIENAVQVFENKCIKIAENKLHIKFKITESMLPGIYISILPDNYPHNKTVKYLATTILQGNNPDSAGIDVSYDWKPGEKIPVTITNYSNERFDFFINILPETEYDKNKIPASDFFSEKQQNDISTWNSVFYNNYDIISDSNNNIFFKCENNLKFYGNFTVTKNNKKTIFIDVPEYQGKVIVRVTGMFEKTDRVININKKADINAPVFIKMSKPAYLNAGDNIIVPVKIFNNTIYQDTFTVNFNNFKNIEFLSNPKRQIIIHGDDSAGFEIVFATKTVSGKGCLSVTAASTQADYTKTICFNINKNPFYTSQVLSDYLPVGDIWQQTIVPQGIKGTNSANIQISTEKIPPLNYLILSLSDINSDNLEDIINKTFPLIYINELIDNKDINKQFSKKINNTLLDIIKYQTQSGGFVNNLTEDTPDNHLTSYTGNFLLEASKHNYNVNKGVINRWKRYQYREFRKMRFSPQFVNNNKASAIYTLAKSGILTPNKLDNIALLIPGNLTNNLFLAASYIEQGKSKKAEELLNSDSLLLEINNMSIADCAILLNIATILNKQKLKNRLLLELNKRIYYKTVSPRCIVIALNSILQNSFSNKKVIAINYKINHGKSYSINKNGFVEYLNIPLEFTLPKHVDLKNTGKDTVYLCLTNTGYPQKINSNRRNINTFVKYFNTDNSILNTKNITYDSVFKQIIIIKNTNKKHRCLSVEIPVTAGIKPVKINSSYNVNINNTDNILSFSYNFKPTETIRLEIIYKAVFKGNFIAYPIKISDKNLFYGDSFINQQRLTVR